MIHRFYKVRKRSWSRFAYQHSENQNWKCIRMWISIR